MAATDAQPPLTIPAGVSNLLRDLLHERTGIYFEDDRLDLLLEKLSERVRARSLPSYLDYYYLLKYEAGAEQEWLRVMDALSVPETYFWRELAQIEALASVVIPQWFATHAGPLRLWSAACASGEEPYSLAIALLEAGLGDRPIEIFASDGSEAALARARAAVYRERSFRALPPTVRDKYFDRTSDGWRLHPDVARRVQFSRANLVAATDVHGLASAPVIFCRNVFIYFSPDAIRRSLRAFATNMPSGGHLFVGASESLLRLTDDFELTEIRDAFVYLRKPRDHE